LDIFSKYVKLYPIKRATTNTILNKITQDYIPTIRKFKKILTDNGTQFTSKRWIQELTKLDIQIKHTTTYHPQSNPVKRANREIGRMFRTYCHEKHTNWVQWLNKIEFWINPTTHSTTGYTPTYIMFKKPTRLSIQDLIPFPANQGETLADEIIQIVMKRMEDKAWQRKKIKYKGRTFPKYEVEDEVLVKEHRLSSMEDKEIHKFFLLYNGLYRIVAIHNNNTITINQLNTNTNT